MIRSSIIIGDARRIPLASGSVHCCVTSPPYWGLRDYGVPGQIGLESTPDEFVATMVAVFREVWRVLRDDGTCWVNLGDTYSSGGRTDRDMSGKHEYVASVGRVRPGAAHDGVKPKDLVGIPWRVAFALQADGWYLRSDIIWHKPNPMPESVTDRPTKSHEYVFLLAKSERYYYDADAIREAGTNRECGNVTHKGETAYLEGDPRMRTKLNLRNIGPAATRNRRSVWTIPTHPFPDAHFATFPPPLPELCIKAGAPQGGIVLDPFGGAGTTAMVAERLGRVGIGIELNPLYARMAHKRIHRDVRRSTFRDVETIGEAPLFLATGGGA